MKPGNSGSSPKKPPDEMQDGFIKESKTAGATGYRKAAGLLLLVGKERAAEILKHFSTDEMEKIVHEIALIKNIDRDEAGTILAEFHEVSQFGSPRQGGIETARQMLLDAFGKEEGDKLYRKYLPFGGTPPFAFLNDLEHTQIWTMLKNESPRVISLVLSGIEAKKASLILEQLDSGSRIEVVKRMARKADIHPDVVNLMAEKFREKIRAQGKIVTQEVDGASALAGILRYMEPGKEESILNDLSDEDEELSKSIQDKIFTVQDILRIPDHEFQNALRDYDDQELAVLIKGKQSRIRMKFLDNLSERRRERISEESEYLGPMPKKDVARATKDFLQYIRGMEEDGHLNIPRNEEEWI